MRRRSPLPAVATSPEMRTSPRLSASNRRALRLENVPALNAPFRARPHTYDIETLVGFERGGDMAGVGALIVIPLQIGDQDDEALPRRQRQIPPADETRQALRAWQKCLQCLLKIPADERADAQDSGHSRDHVPHRQLIHAPIGSSVKSAAIAQSGL